MRDAMARFRGVGWKTSLHSTGLPAALCRRDGFAELLPQLDVAFLNQPTARAVLELRGGVEALVAALGEYLAGIVGRGVVVLTLDEHGAAVFDRDGTTRRLAAPATPCRGRDRCWRRLRGCLSRLLAAWHRTRRGGAASRGRGQPRRHRRRCPGSPRRRCRDRGHAGPAGADGRAMTIFVIGNCTIDLILIRRALSSARGDPDRQRHAP